MMKEYQVVCIDDDEEFLRSLASSLPSKVVPLCPAFECTFEFVASPGELFEILSADDNEPPLAMVISDQVMPGMNGVDLVENLKKEHPDAVCVLLTGHGGLESAKYAINHGLLEQYVSKPIEDLDAFASMMANLLMRYHLGQEERERTAQLAETVEQLRISNGKIKAMHAAAEQVAMLSKGLKSLDFEEVVKMVLQEVPGIFEASWAVLCFPPNSHPSELVQRRSCPCPAQDLLARPDTQVACQESAIACGDVPGVCAQLGGKSPDVVVPLTIHEPSSEDLDGEANRQGYLCMCHVSQEVRASGELTKYKGALVRDIISANLTNAQLYQRARRDSQIDPLTGVNTRRVLEEKLDAECERAVRYGRAFCVAIVDVDRFKRINDESGHATGDRALAELTGILRQQIRNTDLLARYGGDEFVVLMPETSLSDATVAAERMRAEVEAVLARGDIPAVTISCGLAEWSGRDDETGTDVLRRADAALYAAKRAGRNRVRVADAA